MVLWWATSISQVWADVWSFRTHPCHLLRRHSSNHRPTSHHQRRRHTAIHCSIVHWSLLGGRLCGRSGHPDHRHLRAAEADGSTGHEDGRWRWACGLVGAPAVAAVRDAGLRGLAFCAVIRVGHCSPNYGKPSCTHHVDLFPAVTIAAPGPIQHARLPGCRGSRGRWCGAQVS